MTKKDFFRIIIKLFGLYSSIGLLFVLIPQQIISIYFGLDVDFLTEMLIVIAIVCVIVYILIYKPDIIVNLFKLPKGFDDDRIEFGALNCESLLKIGIIIISLSLIIQNIPDLITNILYTFKANVNNNEYDEIYSVFSNFQPNYYVLINSGIKVILGFLMLTNVSFFARKLNRINSKNDIE